MLCLGKIHEKSSEDQRRAAWSEERNFCDEQCQNNMKNYQVWFHRRSCVEELGAPEREMALVEEILAEDAKNYHAWGHRQWLLRTFGDPFWDKELEFVDRCVGRANGVERAQAWHSCVAHARRAGSQLQHARQREAYQLHYASQRLAQRWH